MYASPLLLFLFGGSCAFILFHATPPWWHVPHMLHTFSFSFFLASLLSMPASISLPPPFLFSFSFLFLLFLFFFLKITKIEHYNEIFLFRIAHHTHTPFSSFLPSSSTFLAPSFYPSIISIRIRIRPIEQGQRRRQ